VVASAAAAGVTSKAERVASADSTTSIFEPSIAGVGDLLLNAMNQEQGNTNVND
jgi:hypothetical protein